MKTINFAIDYSSNLLLNEPPKDYLDHSLLQLIKIPAGHFLINIENNDELILEFRNNIKLYNNESLVMFINNLIKQNIAKYKIFYGIENSTVLEDNKLKIQTKFKNSQYIKDLFNYYVFYLPYIQGLFFIDNNKLISTNSSLYNIDHTFNIEINLYNTFNKNLSFIINSKYIDVTCHSQFDLIDIVPKEYKKINWELPLTYVLIFENSNIFIPFNKQKMAIKLKKIKAVNNVFSFWPFYSDYKYLNKTKDKNLTKNNQDKNYTIFYSNFYPNLEIAKIVKLLFEQFNIKVDLQELEYLEFLKFKPAKNQIKLAILASISNNPVFFYSSIMKYLPEKNKIKLSNLLLKYLSKKHFDTDKLIHNAEKILFNTSGIIPICSLKNTQFIKKEYFNDILNIIKKTNFGFMRQKNDTL